MMKLIANSFMTHKHAESPDDCQDYSSQDDEQRRFAVADGATQSFFARVWAELLVEHFCETGAPSLGKEDWKEWLKPIQTKWYQEVESRVKERRLFYLVNPFNAKEPASSTFIGLEFDEDNRRWHVMIIGDSCLFHFRDNQLTSYLIKESGDFSNHTEAFASYEKDNLANPTFESGDAKPGDILVLATDALAKWILEHEEAEQRSESLSKLTSIKSEEQFNDFVAHARTDERIRLVDDDVTLLIITIGSEEHVMNGSTQPETSVGMKHGLETPPLPNVWRFLFWGILAASFGFILGGLICCLIILFNRE